MITAVCTLFEGHYHLGAAALVNSLWSSGFRGRVICGLRGAMPPWSEPFREAANGARVRDFGQGFEVWFVPVATQIHFTNYKPSFLKEMWDGPAADAEAFYYLDPDIVVKCPWSFMEGWTEGGIALCEDVNFYLPPRHPMRISWIHWLEAQGVQVANTTRERYYSGGFIGVPRASREFLTMWQTLIQKMGDVTGSLSKLKQGSATTLFHSMDQDALNMALMAADVPVNGAGWESMDFAHGGHILSHAIGGRKPWRGGFIGQALQGYPPSMANKAYFEHVDSPIRVFEPGEKSRLKLALNLGAFIGRFYRRA